MKEKHIISSAEQVDSSLEELLFHGLNANADEKKGMKPIRTFGISIKDETGSLKGGIKGITYYGCLYIDMLWIEEHLRGSGIGKKLMMRAEEIGKERGCLFSTVNTMDWEALSFYQKLGYEIEHTREGYENTSKMFFLRKPLSRYSELAIS